RSAGGDNSGEGCAAVCAMASEHRANVTMPANRCRIVNSMQLNWIAVQSREMHYGCLLSAVKRTLRKWTLRGLVAADATLSFGGVGPWSNSNKCVATRKVRRDNMLNQPHLFRNLVG